MASLWTVPWRFQVVESLGQLVEIVAAFEESYESDGGAGGAASSEAEFAPVLAAAIDPLVEMCERSAEALKPDAPTRYGHPGKSRPDWCTSGKRNRTAIIRRRMAGDTGGTD